MSDKYILNILKEYNKQMKETYIEPLENRTSEQLEGGVTIATFEITEYLLNSGKNLIELRNLEGMTQIDWGDGVINTELSHTYTEIGEYTCKIYGVTAIGEEAFCKRTAIDSSTIHSDGVAALKKIRLSNQVTSIGDHAFSDCTRLTEIVISDSVTSIGNHAFYMCNNLASVVIPDSVTRIGMQAFFYNYALTNVIVGKNVESIDSAAFGVCTKLASITFKREIPADCRLPGFDLVDYYTALKTIFVPYGCSEVYKATWAADGAEQVILDLIVESDREAMMSDLIESIATSDADITLSAPFTFTSSFGNYTVSTGQVKQYGTAGQSLHEFLQGAFAQDETTVFASSPSYSISINGSTEGEIGATVTPSASWNTSAGTFKYGTYDTNTSSADFTDKTTDIDYTTGTISTAADSGVTLGNTVTYSASSQTLKVTGTISRTALTKHPCSKLGVDIYNEVDSTYTSAITNQAVSQEKTFTGYRKMFMGATSSTAAIDGALIRSLFNGSSTTGFKAQSLSNKEIKAASTDTKIIWAIPSSFNVSSIKFEYEPNKNDWKSLTSAGITTPLTIKVAGAGSDEGEDYTVYVCAPAAGGAFGGQGINTRITIS